MGDALSLPDGVAEAAPLVFVVALGLRDPLGTGVALGFGVVLTTIEPGVTVTCAGAAQVGACVVP